MQVSNYEIEFGRTHLDCNDTMSGAKYYSQMSRVLTSVSETDVVHYREDPLNIMLQY